MAQGGLTYGDVLSDLPETLGRASEYDTVLDEHLPSEPKPHSRRTGSPQGAGPLEAIDMNVAAPLRRGMLSGAGRAVEFAGTAGERALNAVLPSEKTRAGKARSVEAAGEPGRALQAEAEAIPAPTGYGGKLLEGLGSAVPLVGAGMVNPALGASMLGATAGQGIDDAYSRTLEATGDEAKAVQAAAVQLPLEGLLLAPVVKVLGRLGKTAGGSLWRNALDGAITGALGPGSAKVLGEVAGEQITKEEKADLAAALKRGGEAALSEAAVSGPLFGFLHAAAGLRAPKAKPAKVGIKGEAEARSAEPGGATPAAPEPSLAEQTQRALAGKEPGPSTPLGERVPALPDEAGLLPRGEEAADLGASEHARIVAKAKEYAANPTPAKRVELVEVATPKTEGEAQGKPKFVRDAVAKAAADPELRGLAEEYAGASERRKLDLRDQLQDRTHEFLTPADIADIATFKASGPRAETTKATAPEVSARKVRKTGGEPSPLENAGTQPQGITPQQRTPQARGQGGIPESGSAPASPLARPAAPTSPLESSGVRPEPARPPRKPQAEASPVPPPEPSVAPSGEPARAQEGESPIGIKRSAIEAEHAEHGYGPVESEAAKSFGETWENAKAKADADPTVTERVIKGDAVQGLSSDERGAVILREKVRLSNERDTLKEQLTTAYQRADTDGIKALEDRAKKLSDERLAVEAARVRESADRGRGLAAFKMLANKDFSLAGIETSLRIANGGAPLTPEQNVIAERISKKLSDLEKQVDVLIAEQSAKAETQAKRAAPKASPERTARLLQFTGAAAEAARARSKSRGVRAMAGLDPADLADRIIIGVDYLARDVAKFADWSSAMVKEFGETIKPHLQDIFDKARLALADSENVAQRQKSSETRSKKAIDEMRRRIETGDFGPRPERQELPKTPAMIRLEAEKQMVRQELQKHVADAEAARRTPLQKFGGGVKELTEASRALTFSADASATLAQGLFATLDPKNATKVPRWLGNMRRAAFSEKAAREQDIALRDSAEGKKALAAGVELSSPGDGLGPHEEMFRTRWLKAVPGIGGVVKGSDRAFSSYLNQIRVEMYNNWENAMPYEPSRAEKKKLASNAGIMTGRGDPGRYTQLSNAAGYFVTAPRLYLSQWQILAGSPFYGKGTTPATRKVMAQQAVRSAIGVATVFALGKALGGDVDLDPRQPGGPSISFGDTKVHPLGGLGSAARMGLGAATTATGALAEVVDEDVGKSIRGEAVEGVDGKAKAMRFEDAVRYGRGKLLPAWATLTNILDRKDVTGRPASVASELGPRGEPPYLPRVITPLAWNDISKIFREHGIGAGAALNLLNFLGMRVTHYEDRKKVK